MDLVVFLWWLGQTALPRWEVQRFESDAEDAIRRFQSGDGVTFPRLLEEMVSRNEKLIARLQQQQQQVVGGAEELIKSLQEKVEKDRVLARQMRSIMRLMNMVRDDIRQGVSEKQAEEFKAKRQRTK